MKKETVSRFNEKIMTSNDLSLLKGKESKYLMNSLYRSWKEDFTDEDTGEVVCDYEDAHLFYLRTIGDPYIAENMSKFTRGEVIGNIHDNPELFK